MVTGATGLVGNNVVRQLLDQGETVRVLVRNPEDRSLAGLNLETVKGDVRDEGAVQEACDGADYVIHSAAVVHIGWHGLSEQLAVNVEGTRLVGKAAKRYGARMVHVSSVDARGIGSKELPATEETPLTDTVPCPYVITKRGAEEVIDELVAEGLHCAVVNPAFMLGPWDWKPSSGRMLLQVCGGWAKIAPPGVNSFCDVRDVAAATIRAAKEAPSGRRFILAGHSLTYKDAWTIFARVAGVGAPWFTPPGPIAMKVASKFGDLSAKIRGKEGDVNSAAIAMAALPRYYSSARAEEELGYQRRDVEETARDAWEWFKEHGKVK